MKNLTSAVRVFGLWLVLLLLAAPQISGAESNVIDVAAMDAPISPGERMEILPTGAASLDLQTVLKQESGWRRAHSAYEPFGFTESEIWLRFVLRNATNETRRVVLELRSPRLDHGQLFLMRPGGTETFSAGDLVPGVSENAARSRNPVFRINVAAHEVLPVYLRQVSRDPLDAAPFLMGEAAYDRVLFWDSALTGLYFGFLLLMLLANGALYVASRERTFLLYTLYLGFIIICCAGISGALWNVWGSSWLAHQGTGVASYTAIFFLLSFAREFVATRRHFPLFDKWLQVMLLLCLPGLALILFADYRIALLYTHLFGALGAVSLLVLGFRALRAKVLQSQVFFLGWLILYGFLLVEALARALVIPHNEFTANGFIFGVLGEAFVFSIALALRMRKLIGSREAERARLMIIEQELAMARRTQARLLPQLLPTLDGLTVAARYVPFLSVGGDFYAYHETEDGKLGILVADVTGHGLSAALDSSAVRIAFQTAVAATSEPGRVLAAMNEFLIPYVEYRFVSAVYGVFEVKNSSLVIASAGHPPGIVLRSRTGKTEIIGSEGPILGFKANQDFPQLTVVLEPGDRVLLYTDGLYEQLNAENQDVNPESIVQLLVQQTMASSGSGSVASFAEALSDKVISGRATPPEDDITFVVIDFQGRTVT